MYCLLEAVSVYPEKLATKFVDKTEWIKVYSVHFFLILYVLNVSLIILSSCQFLWPVMPLGHFENSLIIKEACRLLSQWSI